MRPDASSPSPSPTTTELCVSIQRDETSIQRGHTAQWTISAWAQNGTVSGVELKLTAAPSSQKPKFTFGGCLNKDATTTCSLGPVSSDSPHVLLKAQVAVPSNATTVTSVKLNVQGTYSAKPPADKYPAAAVAIGVTAPSPKASTSARASSSARSSASSLAAGSGAPASVQSPASNVAQQLPATGLPYLNNAGSPTLSPGGNASGLFPALSPSSAAAAGQPNGTARTKPVANESALPSGAPVIGAQLAGLIALALAFILAVTRLSVRRRPAAAKPPADGPK